jgi:hypothetical protein
LDLRVGGAENVDELRPEAVDVLADASRDSEPAIREIHGAGGLPGRELNPTVETPQLVIGLVRVQRPDRAAHLLRQLVPVRELDNLTPNPLRVHRVPVVGVGQDEGSAVSHRALAEAQSEVVQVAAVEYELARFAAGVVGVVDGALGEDLLPRMNGPRHGRRGPS